MAATVTWDLFEGDSGSLTREGWTGARTCLVEGLTSANGYTRESEAFAAIGLPIGTIHPTYTNSALQEYGFTSASSDKALVTLSYIPVLSVPPDWSISSSANSAQTNIDKDGTAISVSYTYAEDYKGNSNLAGKTDTVGKTVETRIPTTILTIKKREVITGSSIIDLAQTYVTALNSAGWNIRGADAERSWLCSSITGEYVGLYIPTTVPLTVHDTTYVFEHKIGGWDESIVYVEPTTGEPPDPTTWTVDETNKTVQLLTAKSFDTLTFDVV